MITYFRRTHQSPYRSLHATPPVFGVVLLVLSLSCANPHGGGSGQHSTAIVNSPIGARIDDFLTRMSGFGYSGNVLILKDGKTLLSKGYGLANRADRVPYDTDTIFDIGSMAKTFTAAAIVKLEIAGCLSVQDPISKFLEQAPADKRKITVHQLLTHTSGIIVDFPYSDPSIPYEDVGRDEAIRRVLAAPLEFQPGESKAYSNGGYILLAAIVERAAKEPFRDYMRRAVFKAAGLTHTGFWGDPMLDRKKVAIGYNEYGEPLHDPMSRSPSTWQDLGGGQMLSTLNDLHRWREVLSSHRFLPADAVARIWNGWTKQLSSRDGDYGYGWFIQQTPRKTTVIQHGGDYMGTGADLEWFRDEDVEMITSTNVRHDLYPTRNRSDRIIPKIIFGGDHPEPPEWAPDSELLIAASGTYRLPSGGALTIHERGGRYFVGASGQDAVNLLMPAEGSLESRRAALTAKTQRAMDSLRAGKHDAIKELAGGEAASPEFVSAVIREIAELGRGTPRACRVLGTFSSGFPRGQPLDYETTLIAFEFEERNVVYAIRWANDAIAATEVPVFHLAADTPIQSDGKGRLVGWNIVFNIGITIEPEPKIKSIMSLRVHSRDGTVSAVRELGK